MPPVPQWLTLDEAPGMRNAVWALVENPSVDVNTIHASEVIGPAGGEIERELLAALSDRYTDRAGLLNAFSTWWRKNRGSALEILEAYFSRNPQMRPNGNVVAGGNIGAMVPANADASAGSVNQQQQTAGVAHNGQVNGLMPAGGHGGAHNANGGEEERDSQGGNQPSNTSSSSSPKMRLSPTKLIGKRHLPSIIKQTVTVSMVEEALAGTSIVKSEGAERDYFDPLVPDLLSELVDVAKADGRKSVNFAAPALNAEWLHDGMEKMNGYFKNASNPLCDYGGHLHSKFVAAVASDDFVTVALCLRQVEVFEGKAGGAAWRRTPWHRQYVTDRERDPAFQPSVRDADAMDLTESPGICNLTVAGGGDDDDDGGGEAAAAAASDTEGTGGAGVPTAAGACVKMEFEEEGREEEKEEMKEEETGSSSGPKRRRVALGRSLAVGGGTRSGIGRSLLLGAPAAAAAAMEENDEEDGSSAAVGTGTDQSVDKENCINGSSTVQAIAKKRDTAVRNVYLLKAELAEMKAKASTAFDEYSALGKKILACSSTSAEKDELRARLVQIHEANESILRDVETKEADLKKAEATQAEAEKAFFTERTFRDYFRTNPEKVKEVVLAVAAAARPFTEGEVVDDDEV